LLRGVFCHLGRHTLKEFLGQSWGARSVNSMSFWNTGLSQNPSNQGIFWRTKPVEVAYILSRNKRLEWHPPKLYFHSKNLDNRNNLVYFVIIFSTKAYFSISSQSMKITWQSKLKKYLKSMQRKTKGKKFRIKWIRKIGF